MSTQIDSLSIEIQSNSSGAAQGLDKLAEALGELKKNGSVGVAVRNLEKMAGALKNMTAGVSNVSKIGELAGAMERLRDASSAGNSVKRLAKSLETLKTLDYGSLEKVAGASALFERIGVSLSKLSVVKSGGFGTLVNSLAKIGKVTDSLDDTTISRFAAKVSLLSDKLTPLSNKMTSISAGFRAVNSGAKSAASGVDRFKDEVNATSLNASSFITVVRGIYDALQPVVRMLTDMVNQAIEWDGVAARFGRGFGSQAGNVYAWVERLNEEMGINVQQFMQYSSTFATMLTGFGVASEDASKMALGYMELTYDIWAGYNDIYTSLDDAATAVRSAIAGEVEPVRKAGFTIIESTLEQTAANHGLAISLENATEAQKSYLRYLTLVDQAHAQSLVGSYAREMNTAEGLMRTFTQQVKSLAQSIGSLFLPILVKIIPWLQAFVDVLTEAVIALAGFFGIKIQPVDWTGFDSGSTSLDDVGASADGAADSLDGTAGAVDNTTKALKDLKKATLAIDELNVISPPESSGGSGGSGGGAGGAGDGLGNVFDDLDVDSLWDDSIFDQIQSQVDAIKAKFEEWKPVLAGIGAALGALALGTLLQHMGDAISQMNLLNKLLASVVVATIEAALVFVFADNYLEDGNLLNLVGEAVATAVGSYLLYRAWGNKGLVLGIGISIAAQLAAITMNLADGGVEMTDPQLWIQSAFTTALTSVGVGWMAYKGMIPIGTGQGIGIGLLAGLSLTLAAITIGDITANGLEFQNVMTGVLSALLGGATGAAIFTALGVASGGTGFLIGAAVMLAVNVVGALVGTITKDAERNLEEDLTERFGEVELSVAEARVLIQKLLPEWADEVNQAVELRTGVESLVKSIESQEGALGSLEWQVAVGIELTESENKEYRSAIDNFIAACQNYVNERGYAMEIGLRATTSSESIVDSANNVSEMASGELESLGKKLQETVNAAYEDGLLDIDELEAIQNIRNDMREIVNALNSSEIEAEFDVLKMSWTGVELTPDSFETMMSEWNTTIKDKVKPALEETVKENLKTLEGNVAYLELALEKDPNNTKLQQELAEAKQALQDYIDENPLENLTIEANIEAVTFAINTLRDAFAEEIERIEDGGYLDFESNLEFALTAYPNVKVDYGKGEVYSNWDILAQTMQMDMQKAADSMSEDARKNLESMIEAMQPTMADIEEIAASNRTAGKTVPQSIRQGINDYNELKAMAGDLDGINYMIGQGFSTDPVFLNTLATVKGAGDTITGSMREGLLNNMDYVTDSATGLVIGIKDAVTGETIHITPTLEENLAIMGVNLGDALGGQYDYVYDSTTGVLQSIVDSTTGNTVWINKDLKTAGSSAGSSLAEGVLTGAEDAMKTDKQKWYEWALWPWNWFKEKNEINSPSHLFERGGAGLLEGLVNGLPLGSFRDHLKKLWGEASSWWKGKSGLEKAEVAVSLVKKGWSTVKGWIGNIPGVSQAVSLVKHGWTTVKGWIGGIPVVSQTIKLVKSGWSTVKGWIGNIPKLSQTIGLVKSGWSSVKKWVGNMPKLNTKIGLTKSGWSSVSKWVGSMPKLNAKIGLVKSGWSSITKWLGGLNYKLNFTLPKIGINWGTKTFAGFKISYPKGFYTYAKGGFPDIGEMFIAREAGPEMVGKIGNKTAVVNNEQIIEGISEGVYAAVLAAMRASGGENGAQAVNVYLDGKQITSSVEQRQHERGASILGKQVYSY